MLLLTTNTLNKCPCAYLGERNVSFLENCACVNSFMTVVPIMKVKWMILYQNSCTDYPKQHLLISVYNKNTMKMWNLLKVNNKDIKTTSIIRSGVFFASFELWVYTLFCFHCWLWARKCQLGRDFGNYYWYKWDLKKWFNIDF